jgi:hypothetical protein
MDDFLDFSEDYEPVKSFFAGEQFSIFSKAHEKIKIYEDSQNFIANQTIESLVTEIKRILSKPSPYGDIPKLPELLSDYIHTYSHYLSDQLPAINSAIDAAKDRIIEELQKKTYYDDYHEKYAKKFVALKEKAETCNNVATLLNIKTEADALKMRLLDEMTQRDRQIAYEKPSPGSGKVNDPGTDPSGSTYVEPPVKKRKNISIKSISHQVSWQIESKQQLEVYLEDLKEQILAQLEEDTIVNIEF